MADAILMGEPMALFHADEEGALEDVSRFTRSLAGAEVNVGIGLRRLGHEVTYITKLGMDPFGKYIFRALEREGIGREFITFDKERQSGLVMKSRVNSGDPVLEYYRKNSAATYLTPADVEHVDFNGVRVVHMTGILPAISESACAAAYRLVQKAKLEGVYISFDPNLRPQLWHSQNVMVRTLNDLASHANMVLPGLEEGRILTGRSDPDGIADFYQEMGVRTVIIKMGGQGAYACKGEERHMVPGYPLERVVDTVGAGDGFAAGVLSGRLEGLHFIDSVRRGNAIGAMQVTVAGDNEGLPTRERLDAFLARFRR
ncbi:sugar kinase [Christensenella minuta]|uniref:sugar kinase n=2 Tax=Christensenella minuta TaxID=626937 RepID=UPI000EB118FF|nr:sugar kinase [Christensenella minuta]AYH39434.1 2-dehydro-3-deoxygluconokinase [Christensenella minuta]